MKYELSSDRESSQRLQSNEAKNKDPSQSVEAECRGARGETTFANLQIDTDVRRRGGQC